MRAIFDLGHPAHFHLFKNVILCLRESGHDIEIVARQKDCLIDLLDKAGFNYTLVPRKKDGLFALGKQNLKTFYILYKLAKRKSTDLIIGTSLVGPYVAKITRAKSVIFSEDDAKVIPIFAHMVYPFADYIVTPDCLNENYGRKSLHYHGYHELAYLHPRYFQPDTSIRKELGVGENEKFFLVRLVSLTAHHDIGQKGISTEQAKGLVKKLAEHGRVFISAEKTVEPELEPYLLKVDADRIFDVIATADMVIGDSQTMIIEAAVLGTPAIRCNTFVGRLSVLEELEKKYELAVGFLPNDFDKIMELVEGWLKKDDLKEIWHQRRERMLEDCVELTDWIIAVIDRIAKVKS
jgi:hypothetical protein